MADVERLKELVALLAALLDGLRALGAAEPAPVDLESPEPAANTAPAARADASAVRVAGLPREVPIACFFCGHPLRPDEAHVDTLLLAEHDDLLASPPASIVHADDARWTASVEELPS